MSVYFALRIKTKYDEEGIDVARTYYTQVFLIELYKQFKTDTDAILVADGYGDVIHKSA